MNNSPNFTVPNAKPEETDILYAKLAAWCGRPVPPPEKRIYSIRYVHDGDEWVATVGQKLKGERSKRSRWGQLEGRVPLSDPAIVLAIFAGDSYMVATDAGIAGKTSLWVNPFLAGMPTVVTYFSVEAREE